MSEIRLNTPEQTTINRSGAQKQQVNFRAYPQYAYQTVPKTLRDEFVSQHKKNGLFERLYNGLKNITHLGMGSKKAEALVAKAENGEISEEEAMAGITKYRNSQATSAQILGDAASIGAAGWAYFKLNKGTKYVRAGVDINKPTMEFIDKVLAIYKKMLPNAKDLSNPQQKKLIGRILKITERTSKALKSNKVATAVTIAGAAILGGIAKKWITKFDRIGSDEFKVDKKNYNNLATVEDKLAYKKDKKTMKRARKKANFRNWLAGAINGLMMPITTVGGAVAGVPLYLAGNSLNRYFVGNTTEKNKSVGGYFDNLKNDALLHAGLAVGAAIPLFKNGQWTAVFNKNIQPIIDDLAKNELKAPDLSSATGYSKIKQAMLNSSEITTIIGNEKSVDEKIKAVIDENIFAAKFSQEETGTELGRTIKGHCPETRTLSQAQEYLTSNLGNGYEVKKLLGVGTVAETYLVKGPDGKEICAKILKDGVNEAKIIKDEAKFIEIIKNLTGKSEEEKEYLIRNVKSMAADIKKEVNFENEMKNAQKLLQTTKKVKVVKGLDVKNGIYLMEKAEGISLNSFLELNKLNVLKEKAVKSGDSGYVKFLESEIEQLKSHMPDFGDISFNAKDTDYILKQYQNMYIEQFHKIDGVAKTMHGDIHADNIMINLEALRTRKGPLFTLIDTGNVIDMSAEQAIRSVKFTDFVKQGNTREITEFVLDGADLGKMSKAEALEKVEQELKQILFDTHTKIETPNNDYILGLTDGILQKYNIIPNSSNIGVNRARNRAMSSLEEIKKMISTMDILDVMEKDSAAGKTMTGLEKFGKNKLKNKSYEMAISAQEKANYKHLPKSITERYKKNPFAPKTNSKEYIAYKLKPFKDIFGTKEELDKMLQEIEQEVSK